jgi:hypothetical protein
MFVASRDRAEQCTFRPSRQKIVRVGVAQGEVTGFIFRSVLLRLILLSYLSLRLQHNQWIAVGSSMQSVRRHAPR